MESTTLLIVAIVMGMMYSLAQVVYMLRNDDATSRFFGTAIPVLAASVSLATLLEVYGWHSMGVIYAVLAIVLCLIGLLVWKNTKLHVTTASAGSLAMIVSLSQMIAVL